MRLAIIRACAALGLVFGAAACSTTPPVEPVPGDTIVLMIGLDGLRPDAIDRWDAPNLQALAARGARPDHMIPVMPSKTFVNFYSIATGLYPEDHGMITNAPYDRRLDEMFSTRTGGPQDPRWWGGEPIWITAEKQDVRSHIMFWLGSEIAVDHVRPTVWHPYEHDMPYEDRVTEVLSWFDAPADEQPRFAAVYFDHVDTITHRAGPFTEAEGEAVARIDGLVGDLVEGLRQRGLLHRTDILVVSDHGMVPVSTERVILLDELVDLDGVFIPEFAGPYGAGLDPFVMVYGNWDEVDRIYRALDGADERLQVHRRGDMPAHWHFDHPDRGPDLMITADPGWLITLSTTDLTNPYLMSLGGTHGYDNHAPDMAATFIAAGPHFPAGSTPPPFENVNVYGLIACALDLDPADTEADPAVLAEVTGGQCGP